MRKQTARLLVSGCREGESKINAVDRIAESVPNRMHLTDGLADVVDSGRLLV